MRQEDRQTKASNRIREPELLAPAGDTACLKAAVAAGADAVYLGGQRFSARAFAGNFTDEELTEAIRYAHFFDRRIYLTVNTLMKERELEGLEDWLSPFCEAGLDGLIVQDLGVLARCAKAFPGIALHASTQMTVTESQAALFLRSLGVDRIVPARELSLQEVRRLKEESGLAVETFIHGALCYCYSGQCLFSSVLGGRSGNRGRCAQPCRLPYEIRCEGAARQGKKAGDGRAQYPLSLKDLCALPFLPMLIDAGIDSFKIEGRMKGPEYVAGVTGIYRKYIDRYCGAQERTAGMPTTPQTASEGMARRTASESTSRQTASEGTVRQAASEGMARRAMSESRMSGKWEIESEDLALLAGLYVRSETCGGYYDRYNGKEMVTLDAPGYSGCDPALLEQVRERWLKKEMTRPVDLKAVLSVGAPIRLEAECGGTRVCLEGAEVTAAQNRPLQEADVVKQLSKTGGSLFSADSVTVRLSGDCFVPLSALNSLRRDALDALFREMTACPPKDPACRADPAADMADKTEQSGMPVEAGRETAAVSLGANAEHAGETEGNAPIFVSVLDAVQGLEAIRAPEVKRICLVADAVLDGSSLTFLEAVRQRKAADGTFSFFLTLPAILRAHSSDWQARLREWLDTPEGALVDGFLVSGLSGLCLAERLGRRISLSHSFYVFNRETLTLLMRRFSIDSYTAPLELNRHELRALPSRLQERMVYGRIPMMISANCVRRTAGECRVRRGPDGMPQEIRRRGFSGSLTDRYQKTFPVYINCMHCMNTVYNSVPLSLHQYTDAILAEGVRALRLEFTDESAGRVRQVIECFARGGTPPEEYTTGHYKKGVQ